MTKIKVTMAGLNKGAIHQARDAILEEAKGTGVEIDTTDWGPTDPHDVRNLLTDDPVDDPSTLWLQALPTDSLWDLHGEACRRILKEHNLFPKFHGASIHLTLRYGSAIKDMLLQINYPNGVVVAMQSESAPPAIVHSAPFSYDPYNDYYTEVYNERITHE